MTPFDEALKIVLRGIEPLGTESATLAQLAGRVLGAPILAPFDLPTFDRSAVDGYGVRSADSGGLLDVVGEIAAGEDPSAVSIGPSQAVRLFTGSAIPNGVDAIVMQEDTRLFVGRLFVSGQVSEGDHIRRRGAEVRAGSELVPARTLVRPPLVSLLASLGSAEAEVFRRPTVQIVATGSELVEAGAAPGPGQVYEALAPGLRAAVRAAGCELASGAGEIVRDDPDEVRRALSEALTADVVITCGGVSVGDHDLVRPMLAELGVDQKVWSIAMRPGKPFFYGVGPQGQRVFGLPGNPVSAFVTYLTLVRPALRGLQGRPSQTSTHMRLDAPDGLAQVGNRDDFVRARVVNGGVRVETAQESHMLTGLALADALIRLPASSGPYVDGDRVEVIPIEW